MEHAELVLRDLPEGGISGGDDREDVGQCDERNLRAAVCPGDGDAAQSAAGELLDFCPGQFALLVTTRGLLTGDLRQFMGSFDGLGIVAQHLCGQQQRCDVQVALDFCLRQIRHYSHSVAAGSALAYCPGVIVFRSIPTSHLKKRRDEYGEQKSRMSGGPVHIP